MGAPSSDRCQACKGALAYAFRSSIPGPILIHLIGGLDTKNLQTGSEHRLKRGDEGKTSATQLHLVGPNEPQMRQLLALVPMGVERAREIVEIKRHAMRFP